MIDVVELTVNIGALREKLDFDHQALLVTITPEDRQALRISVERCTLELQRLLYRLITLPLEPADTAD